MSAPVTTDPATPPPDPEGEHSDLGFGRAVAQAVRGRFLGKDGTPTSRKYGLGAQRTERFYLAALCAPWPTFLAWTVGALLLINGVFALAYSAIGPTALHGSEAMGVTDPFLRALSFSVGVFTTTGTGAMYAVGATANWLVVFESFVGPITLVAVGGLLIARLTRPRMRLLFSESAIVAPYEGGRGLMYRMTNAAPGQLSALRVKVNLIWFEMQGGKRVREFHELELERDYVEFFTLHWTVVHPITATSPLAGVTPETLAAAEAEFVVSVSAHEETFSTRVISRTSYTFDEVRWDVKFASIFANGPDGVMTIDVDRLGRTERLEEGATSRPAALERKQSS
ncbi:MAG: transporter [Gemmatimonadetes bacterium]|nr:transporter [Gemmatimonadota bacterium]